MRKPATRGQGVAVAPDGGDPSAGSSVGTSVGASEVFSAQFFFLTALAPPAVVASLSSAVTHPTFFTAAVVLAGTAALLATLVGSQRHQTLAAATALAVLDVSICVLMFIAVPGTGFFVLAVLPVTWMAIMVRRALSVAVLAYSLVALLVALGAKDALGDQPWQAGIATALNLGMLLSLSSWAGSRWTRRTRTQLRLLDNQTRLVAAALDTARGQEKVLAEVLRSVDIAVVTIGPDGSTLSNRAAEQLARQVGAVDAASAMRHGPFYAMDGTTLVDVETSPVQLALAGSTVEDALLQLGRPGPHQVPINVSVRRVVDGDSLRLVVVARDVTAEIDAARARDDAVAAVSHEIKTPLTSVLGYLDLALAEPNLEDDTRDLLEIALRNTERTLNLSRDFLAARTREPAAGLQIVAETCRPVDLVRQAVDDVRPAAVQRLVSIVLTPSTDAEIDADPLRFRQVVDNLLTNAVKYNVFDGRVEVVVRDATRSADGDGDGDGREETSGVEVQVSDTGAGMDEQARAGLFTRFYRTDEARSSTVQGTGLGLSIVHDIVEAHHGTIDVQSDVGVGTTVTVWFPTVGSVTAEEAS